MGTLEHHDIQKIRSLLRHHSVSFSQLPLSLASESALFAEERIQSEKYTSTVRRTQFIAGRNCAKEAILLSGYTPFAVLRDPLYRRPIFAEGLVGSISHDCFQAVSVVSEETHFASLGIDIEEKTRMLSNAALHRISTESERNLMEKHSICPITLFSLKEAAYKACYLRANVKVPFNKLEFITPSEVHSPLGALQILTLSPFGDTVLSIVGFPTHKL